MALYYNYCVNIKAQDNGDHEVHREDCQYWPDERNRLHLGGFMNCEPAVKKAKEIYPTTANGCYWCSRDCHTT